MWGNYSNGSSRIKSDYVEEGNARVFVFSHLPKRCRFMTEDVSPEDIMSQRGVPREVAQEILMSEYADKKWLMPKPYWQHTIKAIPNVRYFSKAVCLGVGCPMCRENAPHKEAGVENRMLPYPISKVYYAPAYFYDFDMVLFVKCSEGFFDDVAKYVDRYGSGSDFEIYSDGKGLDTRYKSTYLGPSSADFASVQERLGGTYPAPCDFNPRDPVDVVNGKLSGGTIKKAAPAPAPAPTAAAPVGVPAPAVSVSVSAPAGFPGVAAAPAAPAPAPVSPPPDAQAASPEGCDQFVVQFGVEKGKTLGQIYGEGKSALVRFYANNSAGPLKEAARRFCDERGIA